MTVGPQLGSHSLAVEAARKAAGSKAREIIHFAGLVVAVRRTQHYDRG